jgi:hypothetical protein
MTHDPIQPLADIGRRVLQTARYLTTSHAPDERLGSYEKCLRDPLVYLSVLCNGVLEHLEVSPVTEGTEDFPYERESLFVRALNPDSAFPSFSRTGVPADRGDESASARRDTQVRELPHTRGMDSPYTFEEPRRSIDGTVPSPEEPGYREPWEATVPREPGEVAPQVENLETQQSPAVVRSASPSRDMRYPVRRFPGTGRPAGSNENPYPEERGSELSARRAEPEAWRTGFAGARGSDPQRGNGQVQRAAESEVPLQGSRLTASPERLAAMLRSHVAEPAQGESQGDGDASLGPQGDDERDASHLMGRTRTQPAGLVDVEEIMERLADELETEFVRTYGRSGG